MLNRWKPFEAYFSMTIKEWTGKYEGRKRAKRKEILRWNGEVTKSEKGSAQRSTVNKQRHGRDEERALQLNMSFGKRIPLNSDSMKASWPPWANKHRQHAHTEPTANAGITNLLIYSRASRCLTLLNLPTAYVFPKPLNTLFPNIRRLSFHGISCFPVQKTAADAREQMFCISTPQRESKAGDGISRVRTVGSKKINK